MSPRPVLLITLIVILSLCTACGTPGTPGANSSGPIQSIGEGEGALSIVAWGGYIERGETDKNYDWVTGFEQATGCKVSAKIAATSDEMVALMNEGGFDVVTASGDASLRLVFGNQVQEINPALIPSWNKIDERLRTGTWHTVNGKHYGVPFQWGTNLLMYRTDVFPEPPTSWNVVFEPTTLPDGKPNQGRVQAYDGPIYIADAALYLKTHRPELGITDPYALTRPQFDAVLELLRQQRKLVGRYWHDSYVQVDDFTNEGVAASSSWAFQVNLLKSKNAPIASTVPQEGVTGYADTLMIHRSTPHPNCAYKWLEHALSVKVQGDVASWVGQVPAIIEACKGNALLGDQGCETNGLNNFDKIAFWRTPTADCGNGKQECVPYSEWVSEYIAVIGGR